MSAAAVVDPVLVDFAADVGATDPVAVSGSRTRWSVGGPVDPQARIVSAPAGIGEYRPEEMTVRVYVGTTVAELHADLAAAGQRTALPERGGTVGGALAVGENHDEALGRGPVRNAALQLRYVSADGELVTAGGPTVKNVTGFNLPKLLVGSLGSLGLIAEVVLRTNPIPAMSQWLIADDADPFAISGHLLAPASILWDGVRTWVLLEGHPPDIDAERGRLAAVGSFIETDAGPALPPHRWSIPPAEISTGDTGRFGDFVAAVGVGTVHATRAQPPRPLNDSTSVVAGRIKRLFDPRGRLNPGRDPGER